MSKAKKLLTEAVVHTAHNAHQTIFARKENVGELIVFTAMIVVITSGSIIGEKRKNHSSIFISKT